MTSDRSLAWLRITAVSTISTMKVERPRAKSSAAPTRLNSRSTTPIVAEPAGTYEPICARIAISAFCRKKVLLPAMLGPVTSQMRSSPRTQSLAMKAPLPASTAFEIRGGRHPTVEAALDDFADKVVEQAQFD